MQKRVGKQTVRLERPVHIISAACIGGPKEGEGPLGSFFDAVIDDELWGEKSWEKAESKLIRENFSKIISKSGKKADEVQYIIAGDLLNQCTASSFGLRETQTPILGVYGACSTMGESMSIGAMLIDGGFADNVVCITSSHFCSAEKQFRFPLELGTQRCPTAQWTVTGSGGVMLSSTGNGPVITEITNGKIIDMGIKDANNMGAAMVPAAVDTLQAHFDDTGKKPDYYDLIASGDLGIVGKTVCEDLMQVDGYDLMGRYNDCGVMIFDLQNQDVHAGASGCGCSALVFCGYIYKQLQNGTMKNVLLMPTGALLSPTSTQQGESIPGIAHALSIASTFVVS
jgi:stage V sporulation protein AD